MAIVNSPYVGIAKGRLGEGVFSRVKGQTTVRGYNPSPSNPRSSNQQTQRAVFSSAVKFFSRGVQNFFKFAFENKAEKESDYNAFMRLNANRGIYFGPEQNADPTYPAVGRFIMTKGSLPSPTYGGDSDSQVWAEFPVKGAGGTNYNTMGELSEGLLTAGYQQGDIVTFCLIQTDWLAGDVSEPVTDGGNTAVWDIRQFTLDTSSQEVLSSLGIGAGFRDTDVLRINMNQDMDDDFVAAVCVCVSRPTASGLKVSSSELYLDLQGERALMYGRSLQWKAKVLAAWKISGASILQGSRSVNRVIKYVTEWRTSPELPTTVTSAQVLDVFFNRNLTLAEVAEHMTIVDEDGQILRGSVSGQYVRFYVSEPSDAPLIGRLDTSAPDSLIIQKADSTGQVVIAEIQWS